MVAAVRAPDRRRAILDAALAAFTEKGFAAATVDDVRARSGASVGSIYHRFGGKQELAAALYADALGSYQEGFIRTLARNPDAKAGVRALVRHHLRWVERNRDRARFLFSRPAATDDDAVRELNRRVFAAFDEWLAPHVEAGVLREFPRDLTYTILIGPSQEFSRHWLAGRLRTSITTAADALGDAAWRALAEKGA
jgi:AcrR family transcriptional regulator